VKQPIVWSSHDLGICPGLTPGRLPGDGRIGARFDDQLAAMVAARDDGLIAGIGLSNVSLGQLQHAVTHTEIACVQNMFHLADRSSAPLLGECLRRGIAFVPFCPLGWPRGAGNPVLTSPVVARVAHLRENLAAEDVVLDGEALRALDGMPGQ